MSWLLGKAEDLLNNLDKSAADALQVESGHGAPEQGNWSAARSVAVTDEEIAKYKDAAVAAAASAKTPVPSAAVSARVPSKPASSRGSPPTSSNLTKSPSLASVKSKRDKDEALFEFLNSPETLEDRRSRHSRKSSVSSTVSGRSFRTGDMSIGATSVDVVSEKSKALSVTPVAVEGEGEHVTDTSSGYYSTSTHSSSSAELENKLLKNEISSLNQEMVSVLKRAKEAQEDLARSSRQVDSLQTQMSTSDRIIRELRSRESDLTEALQAKDQSLSILKVRLEESDAQQRASQQLLGSLQADKERILQDHSSVSGVQSQALDSVQEKLNQTQAQLRREQEAFREAQHDAMSRQTHLEEEKRTLAESLAIAQRSLSTEKGQVSQLQQQLSHARAQTNSARQELNEYKDKATRILQSKDRLIQSLQSGVVTGGEDGGAAALERDQLKQERDLLREELSQQRSLVDALRTDVMDLELQQQSESSAAQEQLQSLEEQLSEERRRKEDHEAQAAQHAHELEFAQNELTRQQTALAGRLGERDAEIERLRAQLTTKSLSSASEQELESRLRSLTESLIQKQTALEAVSSEKTSLSLQLERIQQQYSELQLASPKPSSVVLDIDEGSTRHRLPSYMIESSTDHEVTRRVKQAANNIDKFSIRLGVFLRRYPIARVFVIVYMVLLHLWVMIVLLTYQPEIHTADTLPQPPK